VKPPLPVEHAIADIHALRVQLALDNEAKIRSAINEAQTSLSCSTGCAHCCSHPFYISIVEGLLLYRALAEHGHWTPSIQKKLRQVRDRVMGLDFDVWRLSDTPCPLLTDKRLCLAYQARPLNCRALFAVSPPHFCHPHTIGENTQLLPRGGLIKQFNEAEAKRLRRHGLRGIMVPLAEAVIVGEGISTGVVRFEDSEKVFAKDMEALYA